MKVEVFIRYEDQPLVRGINSITEMNDLLDSIGIERIEKLVVTSVSQDPLYSVKVALGQVCPD